jgi:hypothetical protein
VKETVAYCDLDEKDARRPGVAVLTVEIDGTSHSVDVCQPHLTLLTRLPTTAALRAGRRRVAKRTPAKRAAAAKKAPAAKRTGPVAKVAAKVAPARKRAAAKAAAAKKAPAKKAAARKAAPAKRTATKAVTRRPRVAAAGRQPGSRRDQQRRIADARDWARAQGRTIAGKGRLPAGLLEEFEAASR